MVITLQFTTPESPLMWEQSNTKALLNNQDLGVGTLYVNEKTLSWKQQDGSAVISPGFSLEYKDITAHAISKDNNVYPQECVYILLDREESHSDNDSENSEGYSECIVWELILVPPDREGIDKVYHALNQAQSLNPGEEDLSDMDGLFEDAEGADADEGFDHDFGGGGDTEMNALLHQFQNYSVCNGFPDPTDEEQFEDAD